MIGTNIIHKKRRIFREFGRVNINKSCQRRLPKFPRLGRNPRSFHYRKIEPTRTLQAK